MIRMEIGKTEKNVYNRAIRDRNLEQDRKAAEGSWILRYEKKMVCKIRKRPHLWSVAPRPGRMRRQGTAC